MTFIGANEFGNGVMTFFKTATIFRMEKKKPITKPFSEYFFSKLPLLQFIHIDATIHVRIHCTLFKRIPQLTH